MSIANNSMNTFTDESYIRAMKEAKIKRIMNMPNKSFAFRLAALCAIS